MKHKLYILWLILKMYGERCFLSDGLYLFKTVCLMFFLQYETYILYFMINYENVWLKVLIELWCIIFKLYFDVFLVMWNMFSCRVHFYQSYAFRLSERLTTEKQDVRARPVDDFENCQLARIRYLNQTLTRLLSKFH